MGEGRTLDPRWAKLLPQMLRWQQNFKVSGASKFTNSAMGATIAIGKAPPRDSVAPPSLPKGEFDGMQYMMVSDNEAGFAFARIVNVPPGF